jgi:hypothetical protein
MKARVGVIAKVAAAAFGMTLFMQGGHAQSLEAQNMDPMSMLPGRVSTVRTFLFFSFESCEEQAQSEISRWASIESTNLETF